MTTSLQMDYTGCYSNLGAKGLFPKRFKGYSRYRNISGGHPFLQLGEKMTAKFKCDKQSLNDDPCQ